MSATDWVAIAYHKHDATEVIARLVVSADTMDDARDIAHDELVDREYNPFTVIGEITVAPLGEGGLGGLMNTKFALWRYGSKDLDNDIECLGTWVVTDGDTLALSCEGTYDGASLTIKDGKLLVEYLDKDAVQRVDEVLVDRPPKPLSLFMVEGRKDKKLVARVYVRDLNYDRAEDRGWGDLVRRGYDYEHFDDIATYSLGSSEKNPLEGEFDGTCPVCGYECELSQGVDEYYIYCPVCGPDTMPATAQNVGTIGYPPHIL